MESPAGTPEIPLPYVFFPKSMHAESSDADRPRRFRLGGLSVEPGRQVTSRGDTESPASSKGERPPIMTPDERAWNDRLIKSFHTRRSLIDAIVLSPSGVVISTLGRQVEVKVKNMDPGWWISSIFLLLLGLNLAMFILFVGNGFIYIRLVQPFSSVTIKDWLDRASSTDVSEIDCSITATMSLFVIKSHVTFYSTLNQTSEHLAPHSKLRLNFEALVENSIYVMTELLTGRQVFGMRIGQGTFSFELASKRKIDITPVPHCFQDYNALRDIWLSLHYQCMLYLAVMLAQLFVAVKKVSFQQVPHFADPRDRSLTPEQMRTRITIGLEGVAELQRICFYSKLVLVLQALVIVLFQRLLTTIKHIEYSSRHMANQLQKSGLPKTDVDLCSHCLFVAIICGTLQSLAYVCLHSLARYYSSIAASKVPKVRLVPSQDESYVT